LKPLVEDVGLIPVFRIDADDRRQAEEAVALILGDEDRVVGVDGDAG